MKTIQIKDYIKSELYKKERKDTYTKKIHKSDNIYRKEIT